MDPGVIIDNLPYMMKGLKVTLTLAFGSMFGSFIGGTVLAVLRLSPFQLLRWPAAVYVDCVRSIPAIMAIFWVFFLIPIVTGHPVTPFYAALFALTAHNSSYMAEVIRAGIQSVSRTQMEAGRSTGLSYIQTMSRIILPQAFKNMLPALVNRFIALFMGTSLAYIIGTTEFFRAANNVNNRVYQSYVIYAFVAIVYFVCCYSLSLCSRFLGKRLGVSAEKLQSD